MASLSAMAWVLSTLCCIRFIRQDLRLAVGSKPDLTASLKSCLMNRMQQSVESTQAIAESDAIAVERTLAGDRDAYRVLVERHSHNVFRLAYRMTGNRHDAEEVVQEAFCAGTKSWGNLRHDRISGR